MKLRLTAVLIKEDDGGYSSICPELEVASQGETVEESIEMLKEAVELYLEDEDAKIPETVVQPFEIAYTENARIPEAACAVRGIKY